MTKFLSRFAQNKSGATAIEYGLIAALVAVAIIGGVTTMGGDLKTTFGTISTSLKGASASN